MKISLQAPRVPLAQGVLPSPPFAKGDLGGFNSLARIQEK